MLSQRKDATTNGKLVLYWDNGRGKVAVPKTDHDKVWSKELNRLNQAFNYQAAKDLQLIEELKADNKALRSMLTLSEHSLNNAIKKIKGMAG